MIKSLRVILWNEEIGRLAWDERRRLSYFTYNPNFIKKGLNISPLSAPISGIRALMPVWGESAKIYQRLPAFVADSLPDAWGNQLFDLWRVQITFRVRTSIHLTNFRLSAGEVWELWNFFRK